MVVATPELVAFSYELAGIGSRFVAALLDLLVVLGIFLALTLIAVTATAVTQNDSIAILVLVPGGFVTTYGYFWLCEAAFNGQTLGKKATRLRVVGENGEPLSFTQAGIRNLIRYVDFLPYGYAIGVVCLFINGRGRRLGDLAAGTVVVRERQRVRLQDLPLPATAAPAAGGAAPAPPPASWSPNVDDALARRFLAAYAARRAFIDPGTRQRLAAELEPLLRKWAPDVYAGHGAEAALDAVAFRSAPPAGPPAAGPPLPPPPPAPPT